MRHMTGKKSLWRLVAPAAALVLLATGCTVGQPDATVSQAVPTKAQEAVQKDGADGPEQDQTDSTEDATTTEQNQDTQETKDSQEVQDAQKTEGMLSAVEAAAIALEAHPGTQVLSVDLERVRGVSAWEVEVGFTEGQWEVSIDVTSGAIVKDEIDHSDDLSRDLNRLAQAQVTLEEAIDAMLAAVPGGTLSAIDIDDHHGAVAWEGEVISKDHVKYEVVIDAITGQVLEKKIDD